VRKGRFILEKKHQFYQDASRLKSAEYYEPLDLLIIGFQNGTFGLYNLVQNEVKEI
jgi:hypothetical protein